MNYLLQRTFAAIGIITLLPLILITAALIRIIDGPPVLFRQDRIGLGKRAFTIIKFRTMMINADKALGDPSRRVTNLGAILRRSGLDELPQLFNILAGSMAFVGPRALLPEVAGNIPVRYTDRFHVLPGLTGLAQVSGRNELPWSKRLEYDCVYVEQRSAWVDIKILWRTIGVVVRGTGFSVDRTTMRTDDLGLLGTCYETDDTHD